MTGFFKITSIPRPGNQHFRLKPTFRVMAQVGFGKHHNRVAPLSQAMERYRSSLRRLKSLLSDMHMKTISMLVATTVCILCRSGRLPYKDAFPGKHMMDYCAAASIIDTVHHYKVAYGRVPTKSAPAR